MKKLYSLIRACMTSDMKLFKIKTKKNSKRAFLIPLFIALYLMFMVWGGANSLFEKFAPIGLNYVLLSLFVVGISFMTLIEGIYKTSSLIFNCKDDQLLLSLPIKRSTVLFIRVFKFYVFELLFNSIFLLPVMIAYIRWADSINYTYYITSIVMLLLLPIIPIVLSLIIGTITSSVTSKFKYKNAAQIIISMILIIGIMYMSYNSESLLNYLMKHATSMDEVITKIYYPAGAYAKLVTNFRLLDLLVFIVVHIIIFAVTIFILSKFYFKINSKLKGVVTTKKIKFDALVIKKSSVYQALIKKELNTFFKIPVFIVNAGFALVLYIIAIIAITIRFDKVISIFANTPELNISIDLITNNLSVLILALVLFVAFMTSITNSVISLEGRNINILKALPIKTKTILMSKIYSSLVLTTPIVLLGELILFIKFKISIIECLMLLILGILIPLVSHFIGILVNLKYPKLDAENSTEVVKQSASSFISVMMGMVLLLLSIMAILKLIGLVKATWILIMALIIFIMIDLILYLYLSKVGVKQFNSLTI